MQLPDEKQLNWYDKQGVDRPTHLPHGVTDTPENPLSEQIPNLKCSNWRLQGNKLICDTEHGEFAQFIDPSYICLGTDDKGLPILKSIV